MHRRTNAIVATAAAVVAARAGTGVAVAVGGADDDDMPITGSTLGNAFAAALEHTGSGRVTGTEVGDEDSYYEVEVTLDDSRQVDVQLDRDFAVVHGAGDDGASEGGD